MAATINRGRKKRCFLEWWRLCLERRWKNQLALANEAVRASPGGVLVGTCVGRTGG